jgi:hypothetical protein
MLIQLFLKNGVVSKMNTCLKNCSKVSLTEVKVNTRDWVEMGDVKKLTHKEINELH